MTTTFLNLKERAAEITRKKELLKDLVAQLESVSAINAEIKELQEKKKAIILSDVEIFTIATEIKALSKEFNQATKIVSKGLSFKPQITKEYVHASVKSDEVIQAVKEKGNAFKFLEEHFKK